MEMKRNAFRDLWRTAEGNKQSGRPEKWILREIGYGDTDWINLSQERNQ
jgi:hypothetical protein